MAPIHAQKCALVRGGDGDGIHLLWGAGAIPILYEASERQVFSNDDGTVPSPNAVILGIDQDNGVRTLLSFLH